MGHIDLTESRSFTFYPDISYLPANQHPVVAIATTSDWIRIPFWLSEQAGLRRRSTVRQLERGSRRQFFSQADAL